MYCQIKANYFIKWHYYHYHLWSLANKTTKYNCLWIIICLPFFSLCNIWDVMNFFNFIFSNSSFFITFIKIIIASRITNDLVDNFVFFLSSLLLGFYFTLGNLHALVLRLLEFANGIVLTFVMSSPNTKICFSRLLDMWGV